MTFEPVTKEAFFASIGPRNVNPRCERDVTYWETPSRQVVGKSLPGWGNGGPKQWFLARPS